VERDEGAANYQEMLGLITGGWVSQIVRTAAALSLADHLAEQPATAKEIAAAEGSDLSATFRLLRACTALKLVTYESATGRIAGTALPTFAATTSMRRHVHIHQDVSVGMQDTDAIFRRWRDGIDYGYERGLRRLWASADRRPGAPHALVRATGGVHRRQRRSGVRHLRRDRLVLAGRRGGRAAMELPDVRGVQTPSLELQLRPRHLMS
jgi:hypothetical protein